MSRITEEQVEAACRAACIADGHDPDRLEFGNLPYLDRADVVIDGYLPNGDPGYRFWRRYDGIVRAALDASEAKRQVPGESSPVS